MKKTPGILAFDIDGTLTDSAHTVPGEVGERLEQLVREGWGVLFLTGRSAAWATIPLSGLSFAYFLAVQNGAALLSMPLQTVVAHCDLDISYLRHLDEALATTPVFAVVEGGVSSLDACYYRKSGLHELEEEALLAMRRQMVPVLWEEVHSFSHDLALVHFPLIKVFGTQEEVDRVLCRLSRWGAVSLTRVKDPFSDYHIGMVTHAHADKGKALESLKALVGKDKVVIAAGDDRNDVPMLQVADVRIVMAGAPPEVLAQADFVVPPASKKGVLEGIALALARLAR